MTTFDAPKVTISAPESSPSASSMPNPDENDVAVTRLPRCATNGARTEGALRDAPDGDDRQTEMPSSRTKLDAQFDHRTGSPSDERMRSRTRRSSWPTRSRFEPRPLARRERAEVDLVGRAGAEPRVRSFGDGARLPRAYPYVWVALSLLTAGGVVMI